MPVYAFANTLKKDDWVAVISYDMKPHILADFTQDKRAVYGALNQLRIPGFSETNLFDALYDTLDRVDRIEGRKYIILITTGVDTFSKLNLDQIMKKIKTTNDVTIFPISVGFAVREYCRGARHGGAPTAWAFPVGKMDYLQADNEMNTFARLTGGRAYFPRFQAELPEIFHRCDRRHPQPVQHGLSPHQSQARRHLPQTKSRSGGAGWWSAEGERPEGQGREVHW